MNYPDKEFDGDTGKATVTLDEVKRATPSEDEAEASILQGIDDRGVDEIEIIRNITRSISESTFRSNVLSTIDDAEDDSEKENVLEDIASRMEQMHLLAADVSERNLAVDNEDRDVLEAITEDENEEYDEEKQGEKREPSVSLPAEENTSKNHSSRQSVLGAMNATTNALVNNANVLIRRRKKKADKQDVKPASSLSKSRKAISDIRLKKRLMDAAGARKSDIKDIKRVLSPEGSRIIRQLRIVSIIVLLLFATAVISYYTNQNVCIRVPDLPKQTDAPSSPPLDTLSPSASPIDSDLAVPTVAPTFAARRRLETSQETIDDCTTISWVCLFIIRLIVTFYLANLAQLVVIDILCLHFRWVAKLLGPVVTLGVIQSKGWPFIIFVWGVINFFMLYGDSEFANHWLYWQDWWGLFNENNPSGGVTSNVIYRNFNITLITLGLAVAVKRMAFGLMFGKQSYYNYNQQLVELNFGAGCRSEKNGIRIDVWEEILQKLQPTTSSVDAKEVDNSPSSASCKANQPWMDSKRNTSLAGSNLDLKTMYQLNSMLSEQGDEVDQTQQEKEDLTDSQKLQIIKLVEEWDEPRTIANDESDRVKLDDLIHFSQTLASINNTYPFTTSFGNAKTREACIDSASQVFRNLQMHTNATDSVPFETIALTALDRKGRLSETQVKQFIRAFRPDREGNLTLLDFVKSCDSVYKEMRLLQASIKNASRIDNAAENIYNVVFYFLYGIIVQVGLFGFASGYQIILGVFALVTPLSFALKGACGKYVEGAMLILNRKPYQIGDRIAIQDVPSDALKFGTPTWFVENVDLFTTTLRFAGTNEVATVANSSLAACRIVNANRSPNAKVKITLRFGVNVDKEKVDEFNLNVLQYGKDRPREFLTEIELSATSIEVQFGYVEYVLSAQHIESWQNMAAVWKTKVELTMHCHELTKELGMTYTTPALPVQLYNATIEKKTW
eukprot:CAMPEP_0194260580 /NCGR_PEP_ID=MMETSP0158-20130606/45583_1 /TAXON_ID=33649 /ORGANISM="Thalassionema nitzschioides, Strain L26-B" /LENGTH=957 /DNA_ID=CAMNT_0039000675 /DNA_START=52 /DNA_END=2923 /DNA_ORIENTATION=+